MPTKPKIFIGSSNEGKDVAYSIQELLEASAEITIWDQGIFTLTNNYLQDLLDNLSKFDFAILIYSPDDQVIIRGNSVRIPRDNVIFETGLFMGKLGKDRVFFVSPISVDNFHLLSDLAGISYGNYDPNRDDDNLVAALGPFCNKVKRQIRKVEIHKYHSNRYKIVLETESELPKRGKNYLCKCIKCNDETGYQTEEDAELRWEAGVLTATIRGIQTMEMVQIKLINDTDNMTWSSDYFVPIYSIRKLHITQ